MSKMKLPVGVQGWEIAGISAVPIIEAIIALEWYARFGLSLEDFLHVLVIAYTGAAILRASHARRVAKEAVPEPAPMQ